MMKRILWVVLLTACAARADVQEQPVVPSDEIYIGWAPHPQHADTPQPSATNPKAPISIEARCRLNADAWQSCGFTKHGEDKLADDSVIKSQGAGSIRRKGFTVNPGESISFQIRACWKDPNLSNPPVECSQWSAGTGIEVKQALPAAGAPSAVTGETIELNKSVASDYSLRVVSAVSPSRSGHVDLNGATVSGFSYVFLVESCCKWPNTSLSRVNFSIDGTPAQLDTTPLYDLGNPVWNSATLPNGQHTLSADLTTVTGETKTLTATFQVQN